MTVGTQILYAPVLKFETDIILTNVTANVAMSQQTKDEYLGHRPILQTSLRQ